MGHTRLGNLPRTRKWQEVVGLIAIGAGADQIANAVIRAAEQGLMQAAHHKGLVEAFWSLSAAAETSLYITSGGWGSTGSAWTSRSPRRTWWRPCTASRSRQASPTW